MGALIFVLKLLITVGIWGEWVHLHGSNTFICTLPPFTMFLAFKGKNLLPLEQMLSTIVIKIRCHSGRASALREVNRK